MVAIAFAEDPALLVGPVATTSPRLPVPLALEALTLEDSIRRRHRHKFFGFRLLELRRVAEPPVKIPDNYRTSRKSSLRVGGHLVPYTRLLWERTRRAVFRGDALPTIRENHELVLPKRR